MLVGQRTRWPMNKVLCNWGKGMLATLPLLPHTYILYLLRLPFVHNRSSHVCGVHRGR